MPCPAASSALISRIIPALEELAPVGLVLRAQVLSQEALLLFEGIPRKHPAQELEAQVKKVGVGRIRLAVVADLRGAALEVGLPYGRAADADLARQAGKLRDQVERRVVARLVH